MARKSDISCYLEPISLVNTRDKLSRQDVISWRKKRERGGKGAQFSSLRQRAFNYPANIYQFNAPSAFSNFCALSFVKIITLAAFYRRFKYLPAPSRARDIKNKFCPSGGRGGKRGQQKRLINYIAVTRKYEFAKLRTLWRVSREVRARSLQNWRPDFTCVHLNIDRGNIRRVPHARFLRASAHSHVNFLSLYN